MAILNFKVAIQQVNLIDQKGGEKVLEANFDDIVKRADNKMIR